MKTISNARRSTNSFRTFQHTDFERPCRNRKPKKPPLRPTCSVLRRFFIDDRKQMAKPPTVPCLKRICESTTYHTITDLPHTAGFGFVQSIATLPTWIYRVNLPFQTQSQLSFTTTKCLHGLKMSLALWILYSIRKCLEATLVLCETVVWILLDFCFLAPSSTMINIKARRNKEVQLLLRRRQGKFCILWAATGDGSSSFYTSIPSYRSQIKFRIPTSSWATLSLRLVF